VEEFASRALEMRCGRVDVEEAERYGALEIRCRPVDVEEFASRALEMRCRRVNMNEAKRYGSLEMRCRRCLFASRALLFVVVGISRFRSSRLFAPKRFASPMANYSPPLPTPWCNSGYPANFSGLAP